MGILYRAQTLVCSRRASTIAHIYPSVLQALGGWGVAGRLEGVNPGCAGGDMQDPASELPRISIPRTPVNSVGLSQSVQGKDEGDGGDVAIAAVDDFDEVLERFKQAGNEFMKGNPKPVQELFSHRDDVTLANPFGPPARGWNEVAKTQERGASYYRDGEIYAFETVAKYVTPELACILWIERTNAKVGGAEEVTPCDLRVTMTLRPEDGSWKVVHRHADPITSARPAESVIQE